MYRPLPNSPVFWVWQDGTPATTTKFTDTGDVAQWTPAAMIARYGDPRAALDGPDAAKFFSPAEIARLRNDPNFYTHLRFPPDPAKPNLQGFVREAATRGNAFGITEEQDQARSFQQAQDIAATLLPQGEQTEIFKRFAVQGAVGAWPNRPGDSTDPAHPTTRKINGPHGPFSRVGTDGRTYYYYNPLNAPKPGSGVGTGTPVPQEPQEPQESDPARLARLKEAAARVRRFLPEPGRGGAPLQALAGEVRKLLAAIEEGQ